MYWVYMLVVVYGATALELQPRLWIDKSDYDNITAHKLKHDRERVTMIHGEAKGRRVHGKPRVEGCLSGARSISSTRG